MAYDHILLNQDFVFSSLLQDLEIEVIEQRLGSPNTAILLVTNLFKFGVFSMGCRGIRTMTDLVSVIVEIIRINLKVQGNSNGMW